MRRLGQLKGLKINEYGVFRGEKRIGGRSEEEVFRVAGLPFIEPELREDRGEIEAALEGRLPKLVTLDDIKGDFHVHTKASDGKNTMREMAEAAQALGYEYLAITDHTQHATVARGLDPARLRKRLDEIDRLNDELEGLRILKSSEVDILADGSLDMPDALLKRLDFTVCSVHYKFDLDEVFAGYRNAPGSTKSAFTSDGWFRTGDLGSIGADGYLDISGRKNEAILLPGGKKIVPEALEAQYAASPAIGEIAILVEAGKLVGLVVPSPSARANGSPEAAVHSTLTSSAASLPGYMQLSGFAHSAQPLPRTDTGNLNKREVDGAEQPFFGPMAGLNKFASAKDQLIFVRCVHALIPCSRPSCSTVALSCRVCPSTISEPQWVKMAFRTPAASHQRSCSIIGAWPINLPLFLRTIDRLIVAPSPI